MKGKVLMSQRQLQVWGIHAGATGSADLLFLQQNYVALGWPQLGDLTNIGNSRDTLKIELAKHYPPEKAKAFPIWAGQLFRFINEMIPSDVIVYPSKNDRLIHIGQVAGMYQYDPSKSTEYPHLRAVNWVQAVPRTSFTQGALYEIGSAMSFFQVRTYVDEFTGMLSGPSVLPLATPDTTVAHVASDIEEITKDFIPKRLSQELKGHPLADFVAQLLGTMGFQSRVSPPGPDGGIDIIAHKDELGFEPPIIKVQVKSTSNPIGAPDVQALYGNVGEREFGLLVTLGTFTSPAQTFARSKSNLRLIDGSALVNLVLLHYEEFDSRYKGLFPLKRVYVPEAIEEEGQ